MAEDEFVDLCHELRSRSPLRLALPSITQVLKVEHEATNYRAFYRAFEDRLKEMDVDQLRAMVELTR